MIDSRNPSNWSFHSRGTSYFTNRDLASLLQVVLRLHSYACFVSSFRFGRPSVHFRFLLSPQLIALHSDPLDSTLNRDPSWEDEFIGFCGRLRSPSSGPLLTRSAEMAVEISWATAGIPRYYNNLLIGLILISNKAAIFCK